MNQKIELSKTFIHEAADENGKTYRTHYQTMEIYDGDHANIWLQFKERVSIFSQFDWHTMYEVCIDCVLKNTNDLGKIKELVEQSIDPTFNYGIIEIEVPIVKGKYFNEKNNEENIDLLRFRADTRGLSVLPISKSKICHPNPRISYSTKDTFYCDFLNDDRDNYKELLDFLSNIARLLEIKKTSKGKIVHASQFESLKNYEYGDKILGYIKDEIKCQKYSLLDPAINSFLHAIEWSLIVKLNAGGIDIIQQERKEEKAYYLKELTDIVHKKGWISDKMRDRLLEFNKRERRWTAHHKTGDTIMEDLTYLRRLFEKLIEELGL